MKQNKTRGDKRVASVIVKLLHNLYRLYPASRKLPEYKIGEKLVEKYGCKKILDVGCGPGNFGKLLLEDGIIDYYKCIDERDMFRLKDPRAEFVKTDARKPSLDNEKYDCIVFMNSIFYIGIEHLEKYLNHTDKIIIIDVNKTLKHPENILLDIIEGRIRKTPEETRKYLEKLGLEILEEGRSSHFYIVARKSGVLAR